eukprot:symbB.v1.2.025854.t1/scaffold2539.1/size76650/2
MLDKESFSSASAAVDALNRGLLKLPDDFVVVFSGSSGGYYLLYRQGLCEQAMMLVEEAAPPKSQNTEGQVEPQLEGEPRQTMAVEIIELAEHDQPAKAEELMRQALQIGPVPEAYDSLVMAYERCDNIAKAEEWLWRALQSGIIPREECFGTVVVALCKQGAALKVEDTMAQMMHLRMRPPKEVFDKVIGLFAKQRNPIKVEEWLLNAGQSGWTPHQAAFEAVVKLYAEVDTMKAEEWLRRSQETQYRLPDTCYYPVIMGLLRNGNPQKAEDVLSMMKANEFPIDDVVLQEVIALHAEVGNCLRAENLLETMENPRSNLDDLRLGIIDSALRAGEIEVAERQVLLLADPEISRSKQVAAALSEAGDDSRAKAVLESHCAVSGEAPPDICTALLSVCAALGDLRGAEASAQLLLQSGPLSEAQVALLRQTLGDRAEDLLRAAPPAPPQKAAATSRGVNGTRQGGSKFTPRRSLMFQTRQIRDLCAPILCKTHFFAQLRGIAMRLLALVLLCAPLAFVQSGWRPSLRPSRPLIQPESPFKPSKVSRTTCSALPQLLTAGALGALLLRQAAQRFGSNDSALRDLISRHTNIEIVEDYNAAPSEASPFIPKPVCHAATAEELHWYVGSEKLPKVRWIVKKPYVMQRVLLEGGLGFAESYMDGDWDTDDLERLVFEMLKLENVRSELGWRVLPLISMIFWGALKWKVFPGNSLTGAQSNIANTYDVLDSPKLYEKMLGPTMQYRGGRNPNPTYG